MSLAKLSKQLQRDLKKNPKKAGMLALLGVVALWFWAPLVFGSGDDAATDAAPVTSAVTSTPLIILPAAPVPKTPEIPWQDLAAWIEADPMMQTAPLSKPSKERPNPFTAAPTVVARRLAIEEREKHETKTKVEIASPVVVVDPRKLGIAVTSTMVGRTRRSARINGQSYGLGETFKVAGIEFAVTDVQPSGVTLNHGGEKFELTIQHGIAPTEVRTNR